MTQHDRRSTAGQAEPAEAAEPKASKSGTRKRASKPAFVRRDGSGHLDPSYEATLLAASGRNQTKDEDRAFVDESRSNDTLAEQFGEGFVETATTGQYEGEDVFDQVVAEENGGPFVETSARTEFAHGTDASNIKGATREPFPKT